MPGRSCFSCFHIGGSNFFLRHPSGDVARELPAEVMAAAAHPTLDKALDSALNAVPPVPCLPLLLGFAVDQRKSSFISLTSVL